MMWTVLGIGLILVVIEGLTWSAIAVEERERRSRRQ
jgi:hypothetical protein